MISLRTLKPEMPAHFFPLNILAVGNVEKDVSVLIYLGRASISHSKCNLFPSCLEDGFLKNEGSIPPGTLEI